jgi:hypothetical protein
MLGIASPVSIFSSNHAATWSSKTKPGPAVERVVARPERRFTLSEACLPFFLVVLFTNLQVIPF